MLRFFTLALLSLVALVGCEQQTPNYSLNSPNGLITFTLHNDQHGRVFYGVSRDGKPVVNASRLGFQFANAPGFDDTLSITAQSSTSSDETWEQPWGERRLVRDHHNEQAFTLSDGSRDITLRVRAFDDGVGFRYEFPESFKQGELLITDEMTQFALAQPEAQAYWIKAYQKDRYEYEHDISTVSQITVAHTPTTIKQADGLYVTIHEAALIDYSSMVLRGTDCGTLNAELVAAYNGIRVTQEGAFNTPWRTLQISDSATALLSSNMIINLNDPNVIGDVSYAKPGVYMGIWWGMHIRENSWHTGPILGATTEEAMRYIDFISEAGLDGFLVEGWNIGWDGDWIANADIFSYTQPTEFFDLERIAAYAQEKNVALILHNETSAGIKNYEDQMADAYDLYESLGVHYLKTGYVEFLNGYPRHGISTEDSRDHLGWEWNHGQYMINHYQHSVEEAAKRRIVINMHEPIKPTGLRRTYPNFMSREGVRGQEYNAWSNGNQPNHTTILPFTRMMAGPADFTPGVFNVQPYGPDSAERIRTTVAKQLALMVVLYSPLQMAADLPRHYAARPELFQFIKDLPADWEESIPLAADIGEYAVYARQERGSEDWFIGGITNDTPRDVEIDFNFLGEGDFVATIYRDGPDADWRSNPQDAVVESVTVNADSVLDIAMASGGGFAISVMKNDRQ
jgi:alpha-glucosidase